ncbi:phosphotransferase family protein [Bacillus sp. NPDC077027]|uniref:phosphotransferase family protein n=1 Tax=Bacillus sp. NPDC077027 TaxID=3390548 RepID=UPI003D00AB60
MNWLGQILGSEWHISPAGGATGDAYFATHNDQKLFLKRNTSPFLAVLSAEGIVPKLVWTKRMENGDVITAQHWLSGRELKPKDMNARPVAEQLRKIHTSKELLDMLKRLEKHSLDPKSILTHAKQSIAAEHIQSNDVDRSIQYLEEQVEAVYFEDKVVCHCDLNHNNWLLTDENQLYLIDWDGAMIADPAIDLGPLLYHYVEEEEWESWLTMYGAPLTDSLKERMAWYVLAETVSFVIWHKAKGNDKAFSELQAELKTLLKRLDIH